MIFRGKLESIPECHASQQPQKTIQNRLQKKLCVRGMMVARVPKSMILDALLKAFLSVMRGKRAPKHEFSECGGLRFHAFPNSMLATLCANNHQTTKQPIKEPPVHSLPSK